KSIVRYKRLCPAPRNRTVVRPSLFRPPVRRRNPVNAFSGFFFVNSSVVTAVIPRRPDVVGLYAFNPIFLFHLCFAEAVRVGFHCAHRTSTASACAFCEHRSPPNGSRSYALS